MTTTPPPVAIRPSAGGKPPKTPLSAAQATEEMESPATPGSRVHCVLTWGVNEDGQLGHDHNEDIIIPTIVKGLKDYKLRDPEPMVAPLIASSRNTLAICEDGELYTWGWNARGTLGHGHKESEFRPRKVASLAGVKIMQAHIGGWHSLAVSEDGQAFAFGGNEYLQCGVQNPPDERDIITPVACLPTIRVRHVSAGGMHSVAVTTEGTVFQWGQPFSVTSYSDQELSKPRLVPGLVDVKYVSAGAFHNVAVTHAGSVKSWGHNEYGQLGVGNTTYADVPIDIEALHEVGVKEVACGGWHSCAITEGGSLYAQAPYVLYTLQPYIPTSYILITEGGSLCAQVPYTLNLKA